MSVRIFFESESRDFCSLSMRDGTPPPSRSCDRCFLCSRRREEFLGVAVDREAEHAAQVDGLGSRRGHAADELGRDGAAAALRPVDL